MTNIKQQQVKSHYIESIDQHDICEKYPETRYRRQTDSICTIPRGPWDTENTLPIHETTQKLKHSGQLMDEYGRPIHPWFKELVSRLGMIAGRGEFWNWGPNYTADPVVLSLESSPKILLVQRKDNKKWAFPGGFVDPGETKTEAMRRECYEETGVLLDGNPQNIVYEGPVADHRTTAHAWAYTIAGLWALNETPEPVASEESEDVKWFNLYDLPDNIHGSHAKIIEFALNEL